MELSFKCPGCGTRLPFDPGQIGALLACPTCSNQFCMPLTTVTPGMVENELWLQKHVGSGNIGDVYVGKDLAAQSKTFIKVLSPAVAPTPEHAESFLYEMSRWQQVEDSHFITFSSVNMVADQLCLVTPFVEGDCLDKLIERRGPMDEKFALKIAMKVASLLRRAWKDHGLCHRNLRPSNILLTEKGDVYLLDMGNVKWNLTNGGTSLNLVDYQGTVADYMAPEEHEGPVTVAPTIDIYALGATLFFLLTGQKPYTGSDSTQVIRRHLFSKVPDARAHEPTVSEEMAKLVKDMMAKDPSKRIQTWREVSHRLKTHLKRHTQRVATGELQLSPGTHQLQTGGGVNMKVVVLAAVAALLLLPMLALVVAFWAKRPEPPPAVKNPPPAMPTPRQVVQAVPRKRALSAADIPKLTIRVTADDQHVIYLNGKEIGQGDEWRTLAVLRNLQLNPGKNVVAIWGKNDQHAKWVFCELEIGGKKIGRSEKWRGSARKTPGWERVDFDDSSWSAVSIQRFGNTKDLTWDYRSTPARPFWVRGGNTQEGYFRFTLNIKGK